ncbi:ParA family protein [Vibrio sp. S11_S32]|uniref:ParA family protein n=1 Tax=Vibrio sp. S11_S32 TaxID=2720225 RepID=UPI0016813520|nr:ParA family protein [Vibrio sp. S11_S32]MBD1577859.1 ParA family protein [Vibrio sp. S11_S32]
MSGKIVTFANSKGGVGKSTQAVNFAIGMAMDGKNVLLVDSEKDGTLVDYQSREIENLTVINGYAKEFPKMLDIYRNSFDLVVVDTAGVNTDLVGDNDNFQEQLNHKVLTKTDVLIIPIEPSPVAVRKTYRFLQTAENYIEASRGTMQAMMVVNKYSKVTKLSRETVRDLPSLSDVIPVSSNRIRQSEIVKQAEEDLLAVNEFAPSEPVAHDFRLFIKEVTQLLGEEA